MFGYYRHPHRGQVRHLVFEPCTQSTTILEHFRHRGRGVKAVDLSASLRSLLWKRAQVRILPVTSFLALSSLVFLLAAYDTPRFILGLDGCSVEYVQTCDLVDNSSRMKVNE